MMAPDKIVLEHAGALGDFFLAWPVFLSLRRHFSGVPAHFAVRPSLAGYLAPLASPCPPELRRGLDARFAGTCWPGVLQNVLVARPGLAVRPDMADTPQFLFLQGVTPGRRAAPRRLYREALAACGIAFADDYREMFQSFFGRHAPEGDTVLLVPGAGHPDKAWPVDRLEALAAVLGANGLRPVFLLGPAERERGLTLSGGEIIAPDSVEALSAVLCAARCVIGPDCGPLHLAGLHGVPGLALFGPTAPDQWGPQGFPCVTADLPCSPCVAVTSGPFAADCPRPLPCLAAITVEAVWERLRGLLEGARPG
ncbi:MAG: glycosyltransferase family 9 protein [Acidobacteriota bacterium]